MSKASELLKSVNIFVKQQKNELEKRSNTIKDLNQYKLAYDIAAVLAAKDQIDPADFQDTFKDLLEKSAKDLETQATLMKLSFVSVAKDLNLGVLDDVKVGENEVFDHKSPTSHSQKSLEAARKIIDDAINES